MSASDPLTLARDFLATNHVSFARQVTQDPATGELLLMAGEDPPPEFAGGCRVYHVALEELRSKLQDAAGAQVRVVFTRSERRDILEAALGEALRPILRGWRFSCLVGATGDSSVDVLIGPQSDEERRFPVSKGKVAERLKKVLAIFGLRLGILALPPETRAGPSDFEVLRVMKTLQPCSISDLAESLGPSADHPTTGRRLSSVVDTLRRRGLLLRRDDGLFVLTAVGLSLIPSRRDRTSSDVVRALALGRRRW